MEQGNDTINSGVYTLQTVCSWYAGYYPVDRRVDPIALRLEFVSRVWNAVKERGVCEEI